MQEEVSRIDQQTLNNVALVNFNMSRPAIPKQLKRDVLVEAGHRCAIPTCRQATTEISHIVPWAKVKKNTFDNLIALCPNCHTMYDTGKIDRKSMRQYKANLSVLNSRYGDLERRVLDYFARHCEYQDDLIYLPIGLNILLMYLIKDGYLEDKGLSDAANYGYPIELYKLTESGKGFVTKWASAKALD